VGDVVSGDDSVHCTAHVGEIQKPLLIHTAAVGDFLPMAALSNTITRSFKEP
jgi:hypothetical protein